MYPLFYKPCIILQMLTFIYCLVTCLYKCTQQKYISLNRNTVDNLYLSNHQILFSSSDGKVHPQVNKWISPSTSEQVTWFLPNKDYGSFSCANGRTFVRVCALETTRPTGESPDLQGNHQTYRGTTRPTGNHQTYRDHQTYRALAIRLPTTATI